MRSRIYIKKKDLHQYLDDLGYKNIRVTRGKGEIIIEIDGLPTERFFNDLRRYFSMGGMEIILGSISKLRVIKEGKR